MMIIAVYFGILVPMLFLILVLKGEYRRLLLFFTWGLTSSILVYLLDYLRQYFIEIDNTLLLTQIIPPAEEFLKSIPLLFLLFTKRKTPRYSITRLAMTIGIGFSIIENYLYLSMMNSSDLSASLLFIITRSITVCVLHGSMTALVGFAVQLMRDYGFVSIGLLVGSYLLSSTIHSIYNLAGLSDSLNFLGIFIPPALFLIEFYLFNLFGRKNITRLSDIP